MDRNDEASINYKSEPSAEQTRQKRSSRPTPTASTTSSPTRASPRLVSRSRHGRHRLRGGSPPRVRQGQRPPRQALPQARPQGVLQGGVADGDRVRRHGLRRLLRQAHLHPHQQHHRRVRLSHRSSNGQLWLKCKVDSLAELFISTGSCDLVLQLFIRGDIGCEQCL